MADITITIDDAHTARVLAAFADIYNYADNALDGETQGQFAKRMLVEHAKLVTRRSERKAAQDAAVAGVTDPDIT